VHNPPRRGGSQDRPRGSGGAAIAEARPRRPGGRAVERLENALTFIAETCHATLLPTSPVALLWSYAGSRRGGRRLRARSEAQRRERRSLQSGRRCGDRRRRWRAAGRRSASRAGALLGAGLGALACVAYNYQASQTKTAQQVGDAYRKANQGELPPAPVVTAYRTETTRATAKGGDEVTVRSSIEVVPGAKEPLRELREEFVVVDPKGVERSRIAMTPAPAGSGGGAYVSTLQFTFPKGVPPGEYQVQSRLYVNGAAAKSSAVRIQVARLAAGETGVALLE
jgi:hypothetical protein